MDTALLTRIAEALERLAPPPPPTPDLKAADGFVWNPGTGRLAPVPEIARVPLTLLKGIERLDTVGARLLGVVLNMAGGSVQSESNYEPQAQHTGTPLRTG